MSGLERVAGRLLSSWRRKARVARDDADAAPAGPHTVSIFDAAEEVFDVETCAPMPARFAPGVTWERARNPFLEWATSPGTLRGFRLRDVVLDRSLMVLLKDGRVIAETNYLQPPELIAGARVRPEQLVRPEIDRLVASCFDHWDTNYYHWMVHAVPAVQAVRQRHPAGDVGLVLPRLSDWQEASLSLLGAAKLPRVATEPGAQYWLPEVEYYDYVAGRADFCVSAVSLAAYARMSASVTPPAETPRRVYIDRGGMGSRRIPNEAALAEALRARGFAVVRPERLSLAAQVALFKGAGMVVGQLGAGLANIAFCAPGAVIYEIVPEHHCNPCFLAMCLQGGLDYWADMFPTGAGGASHVSEWSLEIDIDHVLRRVEELESVMPLDRLG